MGYANYTDGERAFSGGEANHPDRESVFFSAGEVNHSEELNIFDLVT